MRKRAAVLLVAMMVVSSSAMGLSSEVEFCQFPVPDYVLDARATFGVVFSFDIGADGHPVNEKALSADLVDFVKYDDVASCLSRWKFLGFPSGTQFFVYFHWAHGVGWNSMTIVGPDYNQFVRVIGAPPYCARLGRMLDECRSETEGADERTGHGDDDVVITEDPPEEQEPGAASAGGG